MWSLAHCSVAEILAASAAELGLAIVRERVDERGEDGRPVLARRHRREVDRRVAVLVTPDLVIDYESGACSDELVDHGDGGGDVFGVVVVAREQDERRLIEHVALVHVRVPPSEQLVDLVVLKERSGLVHLGRVLEEVLVLHGRADLVGVGDARKRVLLGVRHRRTPAERVDRALHQAVGVRPPSRGRGPGG